MQLPRSKHSHSELTLVFNSNSISKMKKIIHIASVLAILALTACDKELDIDPVQSVDEETALSNDQNIKRVLNGAYDALSSGSLLGGDMQLYSELLAADAEILWTGTYNQPREIFGKNILTNNSFVTATWLAGYDAINITNNVLSALPRVVAADRNRVEGEAKFIRGVTYFELVKLFALPYSAGNTSANLGVPIVLNSTRGIGDTSYVSRSTIEETYTQIISDLTTAESLVLNTNGVYATKRAAAGYLSRVYLQMGRYAEARDAADRAIGYGGRSLTADFMDAFNNDGLSTEDLFAIEVNDQDGANDMHLFYSIPTFGGRDGDVAILDKHLNLYEPSDQRFNQFYPGAGDVRTAKWMLQYKNLPIIRLAEMYLTRAEANFRLGTAVGDTPLNDVNRIRARVGLLPLLILTLDDITLERKLELAHEGQAIHDVKRLMKTVDGLPYNSPRLVLPIPLREINANPELEQNAGY